MAYVGIPGPAIPNGRDRNRDGAGGRWGVGGGGEWRRKVGGPDSQMIAHGQRWTQGDMAPQVDQDEKPDRARGPRAGRKLWAEGGEGGAQGFRENAGWTGEFARGQDSQDLPGTDGRQGGAWVEGDVRGAPAVRAQAVLQVFRATEHGLPEEVAVSHRFAIGRDSDCQMQIKWDGASKRHIFIEAFQDPPSDKGPRGGKVSWFLTGVGSNGTFLNGVKIHRAQLHRLRDGDIIGIGKGGAVAEGERIPKEKDLCYMFVFRAPDSPNATPVPPKDGRRGGGSSMAREATAGALNFGIGADAHDKYQGELNYPSKSVCFPPTGYKPSAADNRGPACRLKLDFIYGYASGGQDAENAKNNVFYTIDGSVVYPAGTLGVVYRDRSRTQSFFTEHDAPIYVMAMHPNKRFVATAGEASNKRLTAEGRPSVTIMIWDATKNPPERICKPLARQHQYCIHALSFNTSGNLLITLGGDSKYTSRVIIYEWAKVGRGAPGEVVGKEELGILPLRDGPCIIPGGGQRSFVIANNPYTTEVELTPEVVAAQGALYGERTEEGEQEWPRRETDKRFNFVQTVDKASKMWDLGKAFETPTRAARTMTGITTPQKGLAGAWCPPSWFPKEGRPLDPVAAVGLQLGDIYLFQLVGSEITVTHKIEMAHRGEVLCLKFVIKTAPGPGEPGEQFLFSGGRDGKVKGWDPKISWADPCMEFDLTRIVEDGIENKVAVRALDYNPLRRTLVVGTSVNSIFEIDIVKLAQGQPGPCRCLVSAHFAAVTGVAAVPRPLAKSGRGGVGVGGDKGGAGRVVEDFVTVGLDGSLRWWSCEQRAETRCRIFALPAQCVDVSADGRLAAVGHAGGQWSVWETTRMQCIYVNRHASADVTLLKFSPDSLVLSVVSNRREVRLYDCTRYAPRAPAGQEEEFYGDGNIKGREKALLKERIAFMQAHKGNEDRKAPKALVKVGRRLNPEKPARHFMRPPPTSGIVDKIGLEVKGAGAAMLPSFKELAVSAPTHAATITNVDFSLDGTCLRSGDIDGNVMHWRLKGMVAETRVHCLRDMAWASISVPLVWDLKGIWSQHNKVKDVATTDVCLKHRATAVALDHQHAHQVVLFGFPCVGKMTERQVYVGHGARVSSLKFVADGSFLISTGSTDECVMQWRVLDDAHAHDGRGGRGGRQLREPSATERRTHWDGFEDGHGGGPSHSHRLRSFPIITRADD